MNSQAVMTLPLLVGLDGSRKMSKSYDNYIAFNDSPKDIFGKTMSISDKVMWDYYRLLLLKEKEEIESLKKTHPMESKKQLAKQLTGLFYGSEQAEKEYDSFSEVFSKGKDPEDMPQFSLSSLKIDLSSLINVLGETKLFESKGQIRRMISQGGVKLDGEKVENADLLLGPIGENGKIIKAGKKIFIRIVP